MPFKESALAEPSACEVGSTLRLSLLYIPRVSTESLISAGEVVGGHWVEARHVPRNFCPNYCVIFEHI